MRVLAGTEGDLVVAGVEGNCLKLTEVAHRWIVLAYTGGYLTSFWYTISTELAFSQDVGSLALEHRFPWEWLCTPPW